MEVTRSDRQGWRYEILQLSCKTSVISCVKGNNAGCRDAWDGDEDDEEGEEGEDEEDVLDEDEGKIMQHCVAQCRPLTAYSWGANNLIFFSVFDTPPNKKNCYYSGV